VHVLGHLDYTISRRQGSQLKYSESAKSHISDRYSRPEELEESFIQIVNGGDGGALSEFVNEFPFYVDALLFQAEVVRHQRSFEFAMELVQRALYTLEVQFMPSFQVRAPCTQFIHSKCSVRIVASFESWSSFMLEPTEPSGHITLSWFHSIKLHPW